METEPQKINILLVDDNPSNLLSLETVLEAPDRNLVRASSGEEALRYLLDNDAAVILLDVHMPVIDGLETAALIRGRERSQNLPIIFLTAYDSAGESHLAKGYSLGAVDYIIKPIDPDILKSKVAVFVELFKKTAQVKHQAELLREKNIEIENANLQRLSKLIDLGQQLAAERDPAQLLEKFCHAACDIIGAEYAEVGMLDADGQTLRHLLTSGPDQGLAVHSGVPQVGQEFLDARLKGQRSLRLSHLNGSAHSPRFLTDRLPVASFLGAPILSLGKVQGWLYLANKTGAEEFSEADERLAVTLTSQVAVAYENARLYAESQRHALTLEAEVAERKQAEQERAKMLVREQAARAEAEEANRLKDEFLATVSHELRTPLNAMLGWVHLLQGGKLDVVAAKTALETLSRNAKLQARLIDDLLDVSRIITGKLRLNVQQVELVPIIEAAIESVRPAAEAREIDLRMVLDQSTGRLQADPGRLQQVVWNLLSNAVKFTPQGGSVVVRLRRLQSHVEIEVSDTGLGIPPHFLPHVFDRFRQADGSNTRVHGGLGLGLAIVRHLVELHGGTAQAESEGEGQGATFTVSLPLTAGSEEWEGTDLDFQNTGVGVADALPMLSGLRVLVVDDESDTRELLAAILTQCEAEVQSAASAVEALDRLSEWMPDVLISDIGMPEMNGYSFIKQVRALKADQGGRIPAVALTAYASVEDRVRALAAGYQIHVPKPVEPAELATVIASLAGRFGQGANV